MSSTALIKILTSQLSIDLSTKSTSEEIHKKLAELINEWVNNDFEKLVNYLYRIDVDENKLSGMLQNHPQQDAGNIIASLIIERLRQKIKPREEFNDSNKTDISEEEKW